MARPTKLTDAIHAAIVQAVTLGVPLPRAAVLANVDPETVDEWIRRGGGRDDRPPTAQYAKFAQDVQKARAAEERRHIQRLEAAGKGGFVTYERTVTRPDGQQIREVKRTAPAWQASAWMLERTRPHEYSLRARIDTTHALSPAMAVLLAQMGGASPATAP